MKYDIGKEQTCTMYARIQITQATVTNNRKKAQTKQVKAPSLQS